MWLRAAAHARGAGRCQLRTPAIDRGPPKAWRRPRKGLTHTACGRAPGGQPPRRPAAARRDPRPTPSPAPGCASAGRGAGEAAAAGGAGLRAGRGAQVAGAEAPTLRGAGRRRHASPAAAMQSPPPPCGLHAPAMSCRGTRTLITSRGLTTTAATTAAPAAATHRLPSVSWASSSVGIAPRSRRRAADRGGARAARGRAQGWPGGAAGAGPRRERRARCARRAARGAQLRGPQSPGPRPQRHSALPSIRAPRCRRADCARGRVEGSGGGEGVGWCSRVWGRDWGGRRVRRDAIAARRGGGPGKRRTRRGCRRTRRAQASRAHLPPAPHQAARGPAST
jgi:hypothetical protein